MLLNKYCLGEHIKDIENGRAFGTHGREHVCMQGFVWKILTQPDSLEDPDVDWRIVLKWILKQEVWRI